MPFIAHLIKMQRSYLVILTISMILLSHQKYEQNKQLRHFYKKSPTPKFLTTFAKKEKAFYQKDTFGILYAVNTGNKRYLPKKEARHWKNLGLMHLMTPSGLHIGALLYITKFLPNLIQNKILLVVTIFFFNLKGFFAIKRVLIFRLFHKYLKRVQLNSIQNCFNLTFMTDILIGQFALSSLSSIFSFLFWGTIIYHKGHKLNCAYKLFINLIATNLILEAPVNLLSLLFNFPISSLFSIIFPLISFNFWLPLISLQRDLNASIIDFTSKTIKLFDIDIFLIKPSVFLLLFFLCYKKSYLKEVMLILSLLSPALLNPEKKISISSPQRYYNLHENNKCSFLLKDSYWSLKCKKKGKHK